MPSVLIVDDEPDMLELLCLFAAESFPEARIASASSGEAGLAKLREARPDVVLSDFKMGGMDGIEFLRRCGEALPQASLVLMTAYADSGLESRAQEEAGSTRSSGSRSTPHSLRRCCGNCWRREGQLEAEEGALAVAGALAPDAAAVLLDDAAADVEAEAGAAGRLLAVLELAERLEQQLDLGGVDAHAGVAHPHPRLAFSWPTVTVTVPPEGVNLMALATRLNSTWVQRAGSASTSTACPPGTATRTCFSRARPSIDWQVSAARRRGPSAAA